MFRFKQFTIHQDRCPMKVGTDGVLLGAWVRVGPSDLRVLDLGTGTGLIALMLAQRTAGWGARITGIDMGDVGQASENAAASPWAGRVEMVQCAAQAFCAAPFELIVSNPPYFVESLTCPDPGRTAARHAAELTFGELHDAVVRLLAPGGRFGLILPPVETELFVSDCRGLWPVRRTEVFTKPGGNVKRVLTEFGTEPALRLETERLTIGTGKHEEYTEAYRMLTGDFYLKF